MPDTAGGTRNVESLFSEAQTHSNRVIIDLLTYWESLRAGRLAPARSELDPREIKSALGHTFILEFDPVGGIRFRLAGDKIGDLMGMELRGMPASALINISNRQAFEDTLLAMTRCPEIVEYRLTGRCSQNFSAAARMLLLPMRDADGDITRILGGLSMRAPLFDPPVRFSIVEKMKTRIVAGAGRTVLPSSHGFAEESQPFEGPGPQASTEADRPRSDGKPFLRLVRNT